MSEPPNTKITVVNVMSVSFSGSTWVNLLLGSHSGAFSVGEIKKIAQHGKAVCTVHGETCPLWSRFQYPGGENPFIQLHNLTGKRVLVVNNSRKFLHFQDDPRIEAKFIHLIRDGRAVTASMLRKWPEMTMGRVARMWAHDVKRNQRLIRRQDAAKTELLIYEKIKAEPEAELRRLCAFIGVAFEPGMLEFWNTEHHFIGGNRGTIYGMLRKTNPNASLAATPVDPTSKTVIKDWGLKHYDKVDPAKFVDERWKKELTPRQLLTFRLFAGRVNRRYGYAKSVDAG